MSQGDSLHRFRIRLDSEDGRELDLRLARHASETPEYLIARVVARLLFDDPALVVSPGVCRGDEPALSLTTEGGRIALWVEIGTPKADKVERAMRRADRVVVVVHRGAETFVRQLRAAKPKGKGRLEVLAFAPDELDALVESLERDNRWLWKRDGDVIRVEVGGKALDLNLERLI